MSYFWWAYRDEMMRIKNPCCGEAGLGSYETIYLKSFVNNKIINNVNYLTRNYYSWFRYGCNYGIQKYEWNTTEF